MLGAPSDQPLSSEAGEGLGQQVGILGGGDLRLHHVGMPGGEGWGLVVLNDAAASEICAQDKSAINHETEEVRAIWSQSFHLHT